MITPINTTITRINIGVINGFIGVIIQLVIDKK
jgi:hypothetical protein